MKKLTYLFLLLNLSCGGKKAPKTYTGGSGEIYKQIIIDNKIKLIKIYNCNINVYDDKPDTINKDLEELKEFDKKGNEIRAERYWGEGGTKYFFTYDEKGERLTYEVRDYDGNLEQKSDYKKEGLTTRVITTLPNGEQKSNGIFKFNKDSNLVSILNVDKDSTQSYRQEYFYDDQKRIIGSKEYDLRGSLLHESKYVYTSDSTYEQTYKSFTELTEWKYKITLNQNKQVKRMESITNERTKEGYLSITEYYKNGLVKCEWSYTSPDNEVLSYRLYKYERH